MKKEHDLSKDLIEYENLEKQLEVLLIQKHQLQIQLNEINHALEQLAKSQGEVYRTVGSIILHTTKEEAEKDLSERKELIGVKVNAIAKQEEKLRATVMETQKSLQERMKGNEK
jgi:prefoldin beta subunit